MKNLSSLLILSGALALSASIGIVACSSSSTPSNNNNNNGNGNGQDAASTGNNDASTGGTGNNDASTGGTGNNDAGSSTNTCPAAPELYPTTVDGGIYCPFSGNEATDAGSQYCTNGAQMCCVSPASDAGSSSCQAYGSSCAAAGSDFGVWQCSSPTDCANAPVDGGGEPLVCCLLAGYLETTSDAGCPYTTYKTAGGFDQITCMAQSACTGTQFVPKVGGAADAGYTDYLYTVCESDSDCVAADAGSTCYPVKVSGTGIGVCELLLK